MSNLLMTAYKDSAQAPLENAHCLPFAVYHDSSVFDAEMNDIFMNDWVFICAEKSWQTWAITLQ